MGRICTCRGLKLRLGAGSEAVAGICAGAEYTKDCRRLLWRRACAVLCPQCDPVGRIEGKSALGKCGVARGLYKRTYIRHSCDRSGGCAVWASQVSVAAKPAPAVCAYWHQYFCLSTSIVICSKFGSPRAGLYTQ